jgi:endoglucanase
MRLRGGSIAVGAFAITAVIVISTTAAARISPPKAHAAAPSACADPYPSTRDPSNPLMLRAAPGSNPLTGASFFVDGPRHGLAAGSIAHLLGIDTGTPIGTALSSFKDGDTWAGFQRLIASKLPSLSAGVRHQVGLLEKIATEPEPNRFSSYAGGGAPSAIASQVNKIFCHNLTADPNTIPIITTYFMHASLGGCPSPGQIRAYAPLLHERIDAMVNAVGNRPALWLLEIDAIGSSRCIAQHGGLGAWESLLHYEVSKVGALTHAVAYVEGGYSDSNTTAYTARALNRSGVRLIRGFWTNDTHLNWTIKEIRRDQAISRMTGGAHFIINTSDNGNGPKLNPHPSTQGIEDLCNPPRRAMGPRPTTSTGVKGADAFLWTHVPGISSGCGGGPPSGTYWVAKALGLAARANGRLGPHTPSKPY